MNHFHSGFADELIGMSKEAGKRRAAAKKKALAAKLKADELLASGRGKALSRAARSGTRGALYGALFHKLVDPDVKASQALKSGIGVTAGGHIGSQVAKHLGATGGKSRLAAGLVGSALGLRMASKKKRSKKDERKELVEAMKKEGEARDKTVGDMTDWMLDRHPILEGIAGGAVGGSAGRDIAEGIARASEKAKSGPESKKAKKKRLKEAKKAKKKGLPRKAPSKKVKMSGRAGMLGGALAGGAAVHQWTQARRRATHRRVSGGK